MNTINKEIDNLSVDQIAQGFTASDTGFQCLFCEANYAAGRVFRHKDELLTAETAIEEHIKTDHPNHCLDLLALNRDTTGLSEAQVQVLKGMYLQKSDRDTAKQSGGKTEAAIRNTRFYIRKKAREAKILLAVMQLIEAQEQSENSSKFISFEAPVTVSDDRTIVTEEENTKILEKYIRAGGGLVRFPKKQKEKLVLLNHIIKSFDAGTKYSEKEVNQVLIKLQADYVTLRRYLIEYGFMNRTPDGREYWRVTG